MRIGGEKSRPVEELINVESLALPFGRGNVFVQSTDYIQRTEYVRHIILGHKSFENSSQARKLLIVERRMVALEERGYYEEVE